VCKQRSKMKYLVFAARTTPSLFRNNFEGEDFIDTTAEERSNRIVMSISNHTCILADRVHFDQFFREL
jgi:hypothetical protein